MTDKELKHLGRRELLELLISLSKENEALRGLLAETKAELESRRLAVAEAGSLAEAALRINKVFEAAQAAADQYLYNIQHQDEAFEKRMSDADAQAENILQASIEYANVLTAKAEQDAEAVRKAAEERARAYLVETETLAREHLSSLYGRLSQGAEEAADGGETPGSEA